MAATCARFIAIQRQNTPRSHIPTPREIHQSLDRSRFIFRLSADGSPGIEFPIWNSVDCVVVGLFLGLLLSWSFLVLFVLRRRLLALLGHRGRAHRGSAHLGNLGISRRG